MKNYMITCLVIFSTFACNAQGWKKPEEPKPHSSPFKTYEAYVKMVEAGKFTDITYENNGKVVKTTTYEPDGDNQQPDKLLKLFEPALLHDSIELNTLP